MMLLKRRNQLACAAALATTLSLTGKARAVLCDDLFPDVDASHKIFGSGGSAVTATLKRIALAVANDPEGDLSEQTLIFWSDPNACDGFAAYQGGKTTAPFKYWIAGSTADQTCEARAGGQPLDFAHMGNAADLCPNPVIPDGIGDFPAPIQTVNLITGLGSSETSISAEALYFIFGFGPTGQVAPWTDGAGVFVRQSTAFVTYMIGAHSKLESTAFVGTGKWADSNQTAIQTNGAVVTAVNQYASTSETQASQALGYVSGSTADSNRDKVKTLAFQGFGQSCGVYPDSTLTALDKMNVRKGKYALWAQGHYFTAVDGDGIPVNERVANLLDWFSGRAGPPGSEIDPFEETIRAGDIPACAMEALREGTTGAFYSYAPPKPCQGRFESVATGSTEHATCSADVDCSGDTPSCNFGFCEAYRAEGEEEG